jgi:hypothetical protein
MAQAVTDIITSLKEEIQALRRERDILKDEVRSLRSHFGCAHSITSTIKSEVTGNTVEWRPAPSRIHNNYITRRD